MRETARDLVVIGGGPAGLAAAGEARRCGCRDVLLIERAPVLGGILNQCIHEGFGLHRFEASLTGPEYAQREADAFHDLGIEAMLDTAVLSLNDQRILHVSSRKGFARIRARSVVLAMGCRERTAGAIGIPGTRPAGVFTAGAAQNLINLQNLMVGSRAAILGSGDIGLIMARRMVLEGARVEGVFEILPFASGLQRNLHQCLLDFDIPLHLSTTITRIHGRDRLTGVSVAEVDEHRRPVPGTERLVDCDTLLLSVGLIPENELSVEAGLELSAVTGGAVVDEHGQTSVPGIFACGNVLHVHDLVDDVSEEAARAGAAAVQYLEGRLPPAEPFVPVVPGKGIASVLPQKTSGRRDFILSVRVTEPSRDRVVRVRDGDRTVARKKRVRLHPAEMVHIAVKADDVRGAERLEVRVE